MDDFSDIIYTYQYKNFDFYNCKPLWDDINNSTNKHYKKMGFCKRCRIFVCEKEDDKFIIKEGDNKDYKNKVKMCWATTYGHFTAILKFNDEIDENYNKYRSDIFIPFHKFLCENYPIFVETNESEC